MDDIEHRIREDLVAAGFDPDKYLLETNEFRRPLPEELSQFRISNSSDKDTDRHTYRCPRCSGGRFHWNLRKSSEGWGCVTCFRKQEQWQDHEEWKLEQQRNKWQLE